MTTVYDDIENEARRDRDDHDLVVDDRPTAADFAGEDDDTVVCVSCGNEVPVDDYCGHYAADLCRSCAIEGSCQDCIDAMRLELAEAGW